MEVELIGKQNEADVELRRETSSLNYSNVPDVDARRADRRGTGRAGERTGGRIGRSFDEDKSMTCNEKMTNEK